MPQRLKVRQEKMQERRKHTPWREFVMELGSRMPVTFHKVNGQISRFPQTGREGALVSVSGYGSHDVVGFDGDGSFFGVFAQLFRDNSKMIIQQWFENENSDYAECYGGKNIYLSFGVGQGAENVLYSATCHTNLRNVIDSFTVVGNCENIYQSKSITNAYNVFFSSNIHNSNNVWFSGNLLGCAECILCENLENQSYCIRNQQYEKDEYKKLKQQILCDIESYEGYGSYVSGIVIDNKLSSNVSGHGIVKSHDIENAYFIQNITHGRNIFLAGGELSGEHFYDCFDAGNQTDSHLYATNYVGETSSHVYCVVGGANVTNCYYGYHLESCSYCLGCIGLQNKSYCIFNKQYTKEERYNKVDEIFTQMEVDGILGQFFPGSMNPFYFNDTAAYLIDDSFTKEEVIAKGYLRRDEPIKVDIPAGATVVKTSDLDQYEGRKDSSTNSEGQEWWIDPEILKVIIQDEQGNVYRIVQMEYDFLIKYGLPLPRKHWLDRMKENFTLT